MKADVGDYNQALTFFNQVLIEARNQEDLSIWEIDAFNEIGKIYFLQGKYDKVIATTVLCLSKSRTLKYKDGTAFALNIRGNAHIMLGDYENALKAYHESLEIYQSLKKDSKVAGLLNNIANVYSGQGDLEKALSLYNDALVTVQKLGEKKRIADVLNNIASIYSHWGNYDKALSLHQEQLRLDEEIDYKYGTSIALSNIASILLIKGEYDQAEIFLRRSLKIDQDMGDQSGEAENLLQLGQIYSSKGENEKALKFLQKAKIKLEQMNVKNINLVEVIAELVGVNTDLKKFSKAKQLLEEIHKLVETIDSTLIRALYFFYEGYFEQGRTNLSSSKTAFLTALKEAKQTNQTKYIIRSLIHLAALTLASYRINPEKSYLGEIRKYITEAEKLASEKKLYNVICEARLLHALIHTTNFEFNKATKILKQILLIAESKNLRQEKKRIQQAIDRIDEQKEKLKSVNEAESQTERIYEIHTYIRECQEFLKTLKVS
ncbi:MAG: tetratricopeptide repeat protein [Candidatus Hermodarchaeota archaeon]